VVVEYSGSDVKRSTMKVQLCLCAHISVVTSGWLAAWNSYFSPGTNWMGACTKKVP